MAEEIKHNDKLAKEEATPAQSENEAVLSFNDLFSDDSGADGSVGAFLKLVTDDAGNTLVQIDSSSNSGAPPMTVVTMQGTGYDIMSLLLGNNDIIT
jgi:hypothetical protein